MPLTYRWSSRFMFLDEWRRATGSSAHARNGSRRSGPSSTNSSTQSRSVDQDAMAMVAETEDAIAEAASQLVAYGYYTPVIVLHDSDAERLRENCESIRRIVQAEGFGARSRR
jgi:Type IV secretory pathway, VirB4 components